ncbi:MAG: hypothetical protein Q8M03_15520 [Legionella sp.]|nr:hypothetical protein [Legionella sp.]
MQLGYIFYRRGESAIELLNIELEECTISCKNGQKLIFDTYRVALDTGIFFLLEFSSVCTRKTIVIFFDQISAAEYRQLKLLEKIH